jgi:hypothetical protein
MSKTPFKSPSTTSEGTPPKAKAEIKMLSLPYYGRDEVGLNASPFLRPFRVEWVTSIFKRDTDGGPSPGHRDLNGNRLFPMKEWKPIRSLLRSPASGRGEQKPPSYLNEKNGLGLGIAVKKTT